MKLNGCGKSKRGGTSKPLTPDKIDDTGIDEQLPLSQPANQANKEDQQN